MVRRTFKYAAGALLLVFLISGFALVWLVGTNAGARWLIAKANSLSSYQIEAGIEGTIWRGLDLDSVKVSWPTGKLESDHFQYAWQPHALFARHLSIDAIEIGSMRVSLDPPIEKGSSPRAPLAKWLDFWKFRPDLMFLSEISLRNFTLNSMVLTSGDEEPLVLKDLRGGFTYAEGVLDGDNFQVRLPDDTFSGTVSLDFNRRQFSGNLLWTSGVYFADWDGLRTRFTLNENLVGELRAEILSEMLERLVLQSDFSLTPEEATLTNLVVARSHAADRVTGSLKINWLDGLRFSPDLQISHLDLEAETGWPTDLSGTLVAEVDTDGYAGSVALTSFKPGVENGWIEATVMGDWQGLKLDDLWGGWLDGELVGGLDMNWGRGFRLSGELQGSELNPAALFADMPGLLELTATGRMEITDGGDLTANWDARLGQSQLLGRPVAGRMAGRWEQGDLIVEALALHGDGIYVDGTGRLSERIEANLRVDNLDRIRQGWTGALQSTGWLSRKAGAWIGAGHGTLQDIAVAAYSAKRGQFNINYPGPEADSRLEIILSQLVLPQGGLDQVSMIADGRIDRHKIDVRLNWSTGQLSGIFAGGISAGEWSGDILALNGLEDNMGDWSMAEPTPLTVGAAHFVLAGIELINSESNRAGLTADLRFKPLSGTLQMDWHGLSLQYLDPWLGGPSLAGTTSGALQFESPVGGSPVLTADFSATPVIRWDDRVLALGTSRAGLTWNQEGLNAFTEVNFAEGGRLDMTVHSPTPAQPALPAQAEFSLAWDAVALRQFSSWLPFGVNLDGAWLGSVDGNWLGGNNLQLSGQMSIAEAMVQWRGDDGIVSLPVPRAELSGNLQSGWLEADLSLAMADSGKIEGQCRLPVLRADPTEPLSAEANFDLHELGLLSMLVPGVANETRGDLKGNLRLTGSRERPQFFGRISLVGASAEVPALGLKLSQIGVAAALKDSTLNLERLELVSGAGRLHGVGDVHFAGWKPEAWTLKLKGENVQLLQLPEILLVATPDIQISGIADQMIIRGEFLVPTLLVSELPRSGVIRPSEDVVLHDAAHTEPARIFERLDVGVQVNLGDHVSIKAKGLDARLKGGVRVETDQRGLFVGQGMLEVAQGHYSTYGLKLPITRGRASFSGGLLQDPALDVLAERTVGEVKAGVQVTGTPRKPLVKLISTPAMPDTEILSYIVLGRPLGTEGTENDKLMLAAKALLAQGESVVLQEKIKRQTGIDVLEVQSGGEDGVSDSVVAVGKYLTPELYISFGRSLFSAESVTKLRYQFLKNWELESQFGTTSGADIIYRIEFQ